MVSLQKGSDVCDPDLHTWLLEPLRNGGIRRGPEGQFSVARERKPDVLKPCAFM